MVDAALAAGGGDNVTVVVVDITDDGRVREVARKHKRTLFFAIVGLLIALVVAGVASFISIRKSVYLGVKDDAVAIYTGIPIRKSVYLGVKDDAVAIYTGIPDSLLGLKLNWLEDETSIQLKYLPEDTQNRLRDGIPQKNLKDAQDAVENYRAQIDETQTKLIEDARAIQQDRTGSTEAPGTSPADALAGGTSPSESPADAISPSTTTEGRRTSRTRRTRWRTTERRSTRRRPNSSKTRAPSNRIAPGPRRRRAQAPQTPWQAERPRANRPPMPFHLQPRPREVPRK